MNKDWCIENDFAAQREFGDTLEGIIGNVRAELRKAQMENSRLKADIRNIIAYINSLNEKCFHDYVFVDEGMADPYIITDRMVDDIKGIIESEIN